MAEFMDGNYDSLHLYNLMREAVKSADIPFVEGVDIQSKDIPFAYAEIGSQSARVVARSHQNRTHNTYTTSGMIHLFIEGNKFGTGQRKIKEFDEYLQSQDIITDFSYYHLQETDGTHHFTLVIKGGK